jgi:hypothetical protein
MAAPPDGAAAMGGPAKADDAPRGGRGAAGGSVGTASAALATKEQFAEVPAGLISSSSAESAPPLTLSLPPPCRQVWKPFMASRHLDASPALFNRAPLDLHKLFKAVMRAGGYEAVLAQKGWVRCCHTLGCTTANWPRPALPASCTPTCPHAAYCPTVLIQCPPPTLPCPIRTQARVGRTFNPPPSMTDLSYQIKKIYASKLLDFEKASVAASGF